MPKKFKLILLLILLSATIFRIWGINRPDVITDEALIGFRSIGLIDFFAAPDQPTPFEWFENVPSWAHLSFHDHPPLIFWLQHLFFKIFGINLIGLRLLFVIAGVASVFLVYLLGKKLFATLTLNPSPFSRERAGVRDSSIGQTVGLLSAAILSLNVYHVWISKTGLQESVVIFFILLSLYFFIKSLNQPKFYLATFAVLGLGVLSKYNAVVVLPIIAAYLLLYQRSDFKQKKLWAGLILFLVIISPIILYNTFLYQSKGHFDLQLSFLLGQNVPQWQNLPGKEQIGSLTDRARDFGVNLFQNGSYLLVTLAMMSLIYVLVLSRRPLPHQPADAGLPLRSRRGMKGEVRSVALLLIALLFHFLLFMIIGARERFLAMIIPFFALLVGYVLVEVLNRLAARATLKKIFIAGIAAFFAFEALYSYNTAIAYYPQGKSIVSYSKLEADNRSWGYNELDDFLNKRLQGKYPQVQLQTKYEFLEEIKKVTIKKAQTKKYNPEPLLIVYDENINDKAGLWYFTRRTVYQGWPIITTDAYLEQAKSNPNYFKRLGFENIFFIKATQNALLSANRSAAPEKLEKMLRENKVIPAEIRDPKGDLAFLVYEF